MFLSLLLGSFVAVECRLLDGNDDDEKQDDDGLTRRGNKVKGGRAELMFIQRGRVEINVKAFLLS